MRTAATILRELQPCESQTWCVFGGPQPGNYQIVQGRRAAPGGRMQEHVDPVTLVNRYAPISDTHVVDANGILFDKHATNVDDEGRNGRIT